jgi:hypothetical protein
MKVVKKAEVVHSETGKQVIEVGGWKIGWLPRAVGGLKCRDSKGILGGYPRQGVA